MQSTPLRKYSDNTLIAYNANGARYRILTSRKVGGNGTPDPERFVWAIEWGQISGAAALLCDSAYWRRTRNGRVIEAEYNAATIENLDRQLAIDTGRFTVDVYLKGDPVELRWRRFIFASAQLLPTDGRRAYSRKYERLHELVIESINEAHTRLAKLRGADGVYNTFQTRPRG